VDPRLGLCKHIFGQYAQAPTAHSINMRFLHLLTFQRRVFLRSVFAPEIFQWEKLA
jgi:hypothetical protein